MSEAEGVPAVPAQSTGFDTRSPADFSSSIRPPNGPQLLPDLPSVGGMDLLNAATTNDPVAAGLLDAGQNPVSAPDLQGAQSGNTNTESVLFQQAQSEIPNANAAQYPTITGEPGSYQQAFVSSIGSRIPSHEPWPFHPKGCKPPRQGLQGTAQAGGQTGSPGSPGGAGPGVASGSPRGPQNNPNIGRGTGTPTPTSAVDTTLPQEARALLDTIASTEANSYDVIYGGQRFNSFNDHPRVAVPIRSGPNRGKTSSAAGRYQFLGSTWDRMSSKLGLTDFSPASQDRAAWQLAQDDYRARTGRNLLSDLQNPNERWRVGPALNPTWTSLPGGIEQGRGNNNSAFVNKFNANLDKVQNEDARRQAEIERSDEGSNSAEPGAEGEQAAEGTTPSSGTPSSTTSGTATTQTPSSRSFTRPPYRPPR